MTQDEGLDQLYRSWVDNDWSKPSRDAITYYYEGTDDDRKYLKTLLAPRIAFGTAGLRAEMLPGFANFNHVTVRQAVLGLADYLVERLGEEAMLRGVVIGHDHRAMSQPFSHPKFKPASPQPFYDDHYSSAAFATLVLRTLADNGFETWWLGQCITPLVPYATRMNGAAAGIMITASHNPKTYNGLKVYWESSCQINSPHDKGIAAAILRNLTPLTPNEVPETDSQRTPTSVIFEDSYQQVLGRRAQSLANKTLDKVVVTPLHGVGADMLDRLFRAHTDDGFVSFVDSQRQPDPEFPTVQFPNPEEAGALDLAMQQADAEGASIVLSVDPDADRFAAAEKLSNGQWHRFTGNEMGVLLAVHILEERLKGIDRSKIAMLTTAVSSAALSRIATFEGFHCEETLTGFKWMSNRAQELEKQGYRVPFAFEEALGYMFPEVVYDKDGVAALFEFLCARQLWKEREGVTPMQKLDSIYKKYGYYADANTYVVSPSAETTNAAFAAIRLAQKELGAGIKEKPAVLAGKVCKSYRDLTTGVDTSTADMKPTLPVDPKTHMISCEIDDARFTVRGSGTEPKIKLYVESRGTSMEDAQQKADALQRAIIDDWLSMLRS